MQRLAPRRPSLGLSVLSLLVAAAAGPAARADPTAESAAPPSAARPAAEQPAEQGVSAQEIAGWVITGLGGAALVAGTVTGALALQKHQQLAELCPDRSCEPPLHGDVDQFNEFRTVATASIIGAGVAVVAGVTLLLTAPTGPTPSPRPSARAVLGPGSLSLEGTF